ncbi:hypothetical protein J4410_00850 [Candidatus Woesearchaeota archaeon]|nr:hypothetical protein [Candidatus Woesearchaeota archaeon]
MAYQNGVLSFMTAVNEMRERWESKDAKGLYNALSELRTMQTEGTKNGAYHEKVGSLQKV